MRLKLTLYFTIATVAVVLASGPLGLGSLWLWWVVFGAGLLAGSVVPGRPELPPVSSPRLHEGNLSAGEFRRAVNLGAFIDKVLRDRVAESIRLWQDCETMAANSERAGLRNYFDDRLASVRESVLSIYELASHVNSYRRSPVAAVELTRLAAEIDSLEKRVAEAGDDEARMDLERHLESKRTLLASQKSLYSAMTKASLQLDNSVALLRALNGQMRVTLVAGDGYVGGVQEVAEQLNREVEDARQLHQALDDFELPARTPRQLAPGSTEESAKEESQKTISPPPP